MTLDQLRYFRAVCQCDSVSRAAEILNISQPSVSNAVLALEKEFGVALFERRRRKLILTKEGQQMLAMAEELLGRADDLQRTMQALGQEDKVLRRVTFISSPLWLTYNTVFFSLGGIIGETLNLCSALIGTLRLDRKKKEEKAE